MKLHEPLLIDCNSLPLGDKLRTRYNAVTSNTWLRCIRKSDTEKERFTFVDHHGSCQGFLISGSNIKTDAVGSSEFIIILSPEMYRNQEDFRETLTKWIDFVKIFEPKTKLIDFSETPFDVLYPIENNVDINSNFYRVINQSFNPQNVSTFSVYYDRTKETYRSLAGLMGISIPAGISLRLILTIARYIQRGQYTPLVKSILELHEAGYNPITALYLGHYAINVFYNGPRDDWKKEWDARNKKDPYVSWNEDRWQQYYKEVGGSTLVATEKPKYPTTYTNYYALVYPQVFNPDELDKLQIKDFVKASHTKRFLNMAVSSVHTIMGMKDEGLLQSYFYGNNVVVSFSTLLTNKQPAELFYSKVVKPTRMICEQYYNLSPDEFIKYVSEVNKETHADEKKASN